MRIILLTLSMSVLVCASILFAQGPTESEREITALEDHLVEAVNGKNLEAKMGCYLSGDKLLVFDVVPPFQYAGSDVVLKDWRDFFATFDVSRYRQFNRHVFSEGRFGYVTYAEGYTGTDKNGKLFDLTDRTTDVVQKIKGRWLIVHEHSSVPVDLATGRAELNAKP